MFIYIYINVLNTCVVNAHVASLYLHRSFGFYSLFFFPGIYPHPIQNPPPGPSADGAGPHGGGCSGPRGRDDNSNRRPIPI